MTSRYRSWSFGTALIINLARYSWALLAAVIGRHDDAE